MALLGEDGWIGICGYKDRAGDFAAFAEPCGAIEDFFINDMTGLATVKKNGDGDIACDHLPVTRHENLLAFLAWDLKLTGINGSERSSVNQTAASPTAADLHSPFTKLVTETFAVSQLRSQLSPPRFLESFIPVLKTQFWIRC